jgi:hypothetical protein
LKEDKLKADLEALRQQKDAKIRQGEREREEQRNAYELKINGLEVQIKSNLPPQFYTSYRADLEGSRAQQHHYRAT